MYKIMILLNTFSSEISWPISTKFHVDPTVETGLKVCSNGHTPLTVMPIYGKMMLIKKNTFFFKTKNCSNDDPFICCDGRIGKMLHNICISAVAISLRWARHGPWASCYYYIIDSVMIWYKKLGNYFSVGTVLIDSFPHYCILFWHPLSTKHLQCLH